MNEQRERFERGLNECAEHGVPETVDLWPEVRRRSAARARESRRFRILPRTRSRWVLVVLAVFLFGTGAYAANTEVGYDLFRQQLGAGKGEEIGVPLRPTRVDDRSETAHGVRVTLERAYADAKNVAVSFTVEDLEGDRAIAGQPTVIQVRDVELTDEEGNEFDAGENISSVSPMNDPGLLEPHPAVWEFRVPQGLDPGEDHRFRVEVRVSERPPPPFPPDDASLAESEEFYEKLNKGEIKAPAPEPLGEPFVFEFEAPIEGVPDIEVDQSIEANGTTLTLERVENSQGNPEAILCIEPPNSNLDWTPAYSTKDEKWMTLKPPGLDPATNQLGYRPLRGDCGAITLLDRGAGEYVLTVPRIYGVPRGNSFNVEETISGPWIFRFEWREPEFIEPED